jgi:hypothetical protein
MALDLISLTDERSGLFTGCTAARPLFQPHQIDQFR